MDVEPPEDDRGERMAGDPGRYFGEAWERTAAEVAAERAARPPRRRGPREEKYARPAPGVVQVRLTASSDDDIQQYVTRMRDAGVRLWQAKDRLYEHDNGAVCRYYVAELGERGLM